MPSTMSAEALIVAAPPAGILAGAFAADDEFGAAAATRRRRIRRRRPLPEPAVSRGVHASVRFFTFTVDLRERAVALARIVAVVSRPLVDSGLRSFAGIEPAPLRDEEDGRSSQRGGQQQFLECHLSVARYAVTSCMSLSVRIAEQLLVRLQRILHLHLRHIAFAANRAQAAVVQQQRDEEVVEAHDRPRTFSPLGMRDGRGDGRVGSARRSRAAPPRPPRPPPPPRRPSSSAAPSPRRRFDPMPGKIAGRANGSCCISPRSTPPRLRVADERVGRRRLALRRARPARARCQHAVDVLSDGHARPHRAAATPACRVRRARRGRSAGSARHV